jgi:hypothetical protein
MNVRRSGVWDRVTNCDSLREGCLWDLGIEVIYCTFGWHLVWKVGTEVVVPSVGRIGSFGEAGRTCQEGLLQKGSVACFGEGGRQLVCLRE